MYQTSLLNVTFLVISSTLVRSKKHGYSLEDCSDRLAARPH